MAFVFDASFFPVGILLVIAISLQMSYKNAKSTQSHTHKKVPHRNGTITHFICPVAKNQSQTKA